MNRQNHSSQPKPPKHPRPVWVPEYFEEVKKLYPDKKLQLKYVNGSWHVHAYQSWWDKEKKRPEKKEEYLGTIKEDGFHPRRRRYPRRKKGTEIEKMEEKPLVRERSYEYGASEVCRQFLESALEGLKDQIDEERAKAIVGLAVLWAVHGYVLLKRVASVWEDTWLSRLWEAVRMDGRRLSELLKLVGRRVGL